MRRRRGLGHETPWASISFEHVASLRQGRQGRSGARRRRPRDRRQASSSRSSARRAAARRPACAWRPGFELPSPARVSVGGMRSRARAGPCRRVPAVRAVSVEDRARKHRLRPAQQGRARRPSGSDRVGRHIKLMGLERLRGRLSAPALRRHAAARRDRPRLRARARSAADGRAVRRARRADPRRDAGRAGAPRARQSAHGALHHPRGGGGRLPRRPRRRS